MVALFINTDSVSAGESEEQKVKPVASVEVPAFTEKKEKTFEVITENKPPATEKPEKKPVKYVVKEGDSLSKIATVKETSWKRLWQKNKNIKHPDEIYVGDEYIIPEASEKLKERELPIPPVVVAEVAPRPVETSEPPTAPRTTRRVQTPQAPAPTPRPARTPVRRSYAGNTYHYRSCTWHVKNWRADIPNTLGNANQWYYRAQSMGMATGTTPRVGAVGATSRGAYGHVVLVTAVHSNGIITIREGNYDFNGSVRTRTANASEFVYIY